MNSTTKELNYRVFAGFAVSAELKNELTQSKEWNLLRILPLNDRKKLSLVRFESKEFIGVYLPDKQLTLLEISRVAEDLKDKLRTLCPKLNVAKPQLKLFTQAFIP